jgi:DNA-binding LacI/PurR family transcriptional regulator
VATIKDIARELGISTSTVSYALNGGPRPVPAEVRRKVLELARQLDYRPNRVARSLVTRSAGVIGVVPPSVETNVFNSPFVRMTWNAIVNEAEQLGQDLLLFTGSNRNSPDQPGLEFLDGRIDGVVFIAPRRDTLAIEFLATRNFPMACIASSEDGNLNYKIDNLGGVRQAVEHLISLGHRRIAHVAGHKDSPDSAARETAFRTVVKEHPEIELLEGFVQSADFTTPGGYQAAKRLLSLQRRPTAVFASNDEMAYGIAQALHDSGLEVPRDMSLVGFDDCDFSFAFSPPLTTVRQPVVPMASSALRAVAALIHQKEPMPATVFPTELIIRSSTTKPTEVQ